MFYKLVERPTCHQNFRPRRRDRLGSTSRRSRGSSKIVYVSISAMATAARWSTAGPGPAGAELFRRNYNAGLADGLPHPSPLHRRRGGHHNACEAVLAGIMPARRHGVGRCQGVPARSCARGPIQRSPPILHGARARAGGDLRQHVDGAAVRHLPLGGRHMAIAQSSLTRSQRSRRRRDRGAAAHGRRQRMMQRSRLARQGLPGRRRRLRVARAM